MGLSISPTELARRAKISKTKTGKRRPAKVRAKIAAGMKRYRALKAREASAREAPELVGAE